MNDDDGMLIQGEVRAPTSLSAELVAQSMLLPGVLCLTKPVFVPVVNLSALTGQPVRRVVLCGNAVQRVEFDADDARTDALELEDLQLDNNRIEEMPLTLAARLPRLQSLSLARNALRSFGWISQFVTLTKLDIRHNHGAEALAFLRTLVQLEDLSISCCALSTIETLPTSIVCLRRLSLSCNRLADLASCVSVLRQLPALRHVLVECNPFTLRVHRVQFVEALDRYELVADSASSQLSLDVDMFHVAAYYRCAMRRLLPQLETIDEIAVTEFVDPVDIIVAQ